MGTLLSARGRARIAGLDIAIMPKYQYVITPFFRLKNSSFVEKMAIRDQGVQKEIDMNNLRKFQGISLVELMIGLGLTSGLVLMDLERQKNNRVAVQSQEATEAVSGLKSNLRSWLRQGTQGSDLSAGGVATTSAIANSFGMGATNRVNIYETTATTTGAIIRNREVDTAVDSSSDEFVITSINLDNAGTPTSMIAQQELPLGVPPGTGVKLMGPTTSGGNIRSLDDAGWTYIRSMWVQNFQEYENNTVDIDGDSVTETVRRGSANLNVLIWKYNNLIENPGLDCLTNKNCERELLTFPLDLRVEDDGTKKQIVDGTFGLQCRQAGEAGGNGRVRITGSHNCASNEFFAQGEPVDDREWAGAVGGPTVSGSDSSIDAFLNSRCCRFVQ